MLMFGKSWHSSVLNAIAITIFVLVFMPTSRGDLLETIPGWNDEAAAYVARELDTSSAGLHISDGRYSSDRLGTFKNVSTISDTHGDTEGDALWTAYQMYKRLDGIHENAASDWYTRAQNLANFFKNSYIGGSAWSKDGSFNFDHIYGWGLCEWAGGVR